MTKGYTRQQLPDFENTAIAFSSKSNRALTRTVRLFQMMNQPWLVNWGTNLTLMAIKYKLPLAKTIIKQTIFNQFCGGLSLHECHAAINKLAEYDVQSILDYGAEAKDNEEDFINSELEIVRAIDFAAANQSVPVVSLKITGLTQFKLLEKVQKKQELSDSEKEEYRLLKSKLEHIGQVAEEKEVGIFIDAEESWIQDTIDILVMQMQERHNRKKVIIYNTFQMYRHDRLAYLKDCFNHAQDKQFILGAKIVRGAYMEKERSRAIKMGYPSPIQKDKQATDKDYNQAIIFCMDNYENIAFYNASHNVESASLQAQLTAEKAIDKRHPHLNFCQLYGMSDHITFNLAAKGFSTMKYLPYGKVEEVIPYLIRRAQENTAVSGEMGREYNLLLDEVQRRKA